jgi:ankyrin repeat protein
MTNSIYTTVCLILFLNGFFSICQGKRTQLSPSVNCIPSDSFLVVSLNTQTLLQKSHFLSSETWKPILDQWRSQNADIQELLDNPQNSGISLNTPLQFFVRLQGNPFPTPVWGVLASVEDELKLDSLLSRFAEKFNLKEKGGNNLRFGNKTLPFEMGRNGKWGYVLGLLPNPRNPPSPDFELQMDQIVQDIFRKREQVSFPQPLKTHFIHSADASVYWEGVGLSKLIEDFLMEDSFKHILPVFDFLAHRSWGVHIYSDPGKLQASLLDYTDTATEQKTHIAPKTRPKNDSLSNQTPGDIPLIAKLDFPQSAFKETVSSIIDSSLNLLSGGNFEAAKPLPGFGITFSELLDAFSGKFILAGGDLSLKPNLSPSPPDSFLARFKSSFLLGCEINEPFAAKQLLAGIRSSSALLSIIEANRLKIIDSGNVLWLCTEDYQRELNAKKPIHPLTKARRQNLQTSPLSLDFNISSFTQNVRDEGNLFFEENKILQTFDKFTHLKCKTKPNALHFQLDLNQPTIQGLEVILDLWGQEIIDARNDSLYRAIAQNDLNALALSIQQGALINANDRFGHTPLHYCAFKGNARLVDYLLRNGGNANVKGRHLSTPLHSAAWGRNMDVFELLLEDGADVNARTDEGETPGMTAALRGEKEMLEVLFALSADPHAQDNHGSNMLDLAAAGGHEEIVDLLSQMKVAQKHPLHVAAGLGKLQRVKELLKNGHDVNEPDSFGATPLLIAVVSRKMDVVQFLLSQKADPKICAKEGYTLMHGAAFSGSKEMVKLALSYGLQVNPRYGKDGITPVDVAEDKQEALPYLRSFGGKASWELAPVRP